MMIVNTTPHEGSIALMSPALWIEEASISERGVLLVRAAWRSAAGAAPPRLELAIDGRFAGSLPAHTGGLFEGWFVLGGEAARARHVAVTGGGAEATAPLAGRLGPAWGWFTDATWTASPALEAALRPGALGVLLISDLLPRDGVARWLPIAQLAAALRQSGHRPILLHFGALSDCRSEVAVLLKSFDVVHHHSTGMAVLDWNPASPGALPPVDYALPEAIVAIARITGCALVMAVSPAGLNVLSRLPQHLPRGALLSRSLVLAPRMIFAPVPREKAAATLRSILAGATVVLEDEGLQLELAKWLPAPRTAVLPPLVALPPTGAALTAAPVVTAAVGATAARAVTRILPPGAAVTMLDDATPLHVLAEAITHATRLVLWSDAGVAGRVARHLAGLRGVPVIGRPPSPLPAAGDGEARLAALLTEFETCGTVLLPELPPAWSAVDFAVKLGLTPAVVED